MTFLRTAVEGANEARLLQVISGAGGWPVKSTVDPGLGQGRRDNNGGGEADDLV